MNSKDRRYFERHRPIPPNEELPKKPPKEPKPPKPFLERSLITLQKYYKRGLAFVLASTALVGFAYSFRPIIAFESEEFLNPADPFSAMFRITNNSPLSLRDVWLEQSFKTTKASYSKFLNNDPRAIKPVPAEWGPYVAYPEIAPGEPVTVKFPFTAVGNQDTQNITIMIKFTYSYLFHFQAEQRFISRVDSSGHPHWFHAPLN